MMSCLLIDDHELLRVGLRFAIESAFAGAHVSEVGSLATALASLREAEQPNLVLLDPGLPDAGGVASLQAIRVAHPSLPIIMVSGSTDGDFVSRCFALGAMGFVPKSVGSKQIVSCVHSVLAGRIYRPDLEQAGVRSLREKLTRREEEIVLFCASGLQNKEIGLRLGISDNTVRAHLGNIFKRFDLTSRADTRLLVKRLGLEEPVQH